jgi:hypothetical protein
MKPFNVLLAFALIVVNSTNLFSQLNKIDFTSLLNNTKDTVTVTVQDFTPPFDVFVYDAPPFKGGKLVNKNEKVVSKTFQIECSKFTTVSICIVKNDSTYGIKTIDIKK